jgi:hypothetical protein
MAFAREKEASPFPGSPIANKKVIQPLRRKDPKQRLSWEKPSPEREAFLQPDKTD